MQSSKIQLQKNLSTFDELKFKAVQIHFLSVVVVAAVVV